MRIARVFPTKTNMCPTDKDAFFGPPPKGVRKKAYDQVHISTSFTWDVDKAIELIQEWLDYVKPPMSNLKIGGPAFDDCGVEFEPGMYLKPGVVITSRGCPNKCAHCFVPKREGKIRELEVKEGRILQDNNILACSNRHFDEVVRMLKTQRCIEFAGGLDADRVDEEVVDILRGLRMYQMFVGYDRPGQGRAVKRAVGLLGKYFNWRRIRIYVLIGYEGDTLSKARQRLVRVLEWGAMPYAMLFRGPGDKEEYSKEWKQLKWAFSRPIVMCIMKKNMDKIGKMVIDRSTGLGVRFG